MNRIAKIALIATALVAGTTGAASAFGPGRHHGGGCMGGGFEDGMGPMGMGFGPGQAGGQQIDKQLSVDDVRAIIAGRLAMSGNKRLKVGQVTEKNADTITAEVVTVDNSLVRRMEINRHTGQHVPVQ